jgi:hypothetical protein
MVLTTTSNLYFAVTLLFIVSRKRELLFDFYIREGKYVS